MDAVKFLQERQRMYKSGAATPSIRLGTDYDPVSAVEVVEKWSAAHPVKTRQSVFLEQYPDADISGNGVVAISLKLMRLADLESLCSYDRLRELAEADKGGRVVVLPCKPDGSMLNISDPERPEIMKRIHFAVAYVCGGIVFHQPYNIFIENVAAGYIRPLNEEAEKALGAKKDG